MTTIAKTLCVFTGQGPEDIRILGGTAKWRLNTGLLLETCRYVLCVHNGAARLPFAHGNPPGRDRAAFLIGRIAGVEEVKVGDPLFYFGDRWEVANRQLVRISDYCEIDVPDFMPAWRNPTVYLPEDEVLEKLGIAGFDALDFTPLAPASQAERAAYATRLVEAGGDDTGPAGYAVLPGVSRPSVGIGIEAAKEGLAAHFGVTADQIDITIRW